MSESSTFDIEIGQSLKSKDSFKNLATMRKVKSQKQPEKFVWHDKFADYDESDDEFSKGVTKTAYGKTNLERLTYFTAKKTTFSYDDHYYQASATKFAQTVSWRKRHMPSFQIFVDFLVAMFVTNLFIGTLVYYYKRFLNEKMNSV